MSKLLFHRTTRSLETVAAAPGIDQDGLRHRRQRQGLTLDVFRSPAAGKRALVQRQESCAVATKRTLVLSGTSTLRSSAVALTSHLRELPDLNPVRGVPQLLAVYAVALLCRQLRTRAVEGRVILGSTVSRPKPRALRPRGTQHVPALPMTRS